MNPRKPPPEGMSRAPTNQGFQAGPGMMVGVGFVAHDDEGQKLDTDELRLEFVFGFGQLLPRLELALDGARVGDEREVTLQPDEAFGRRDPRAVLEVERCEFPELVEPGDSFELENAEGEVLVMTVLDVTDSAVLLDTNHPLAGQNVRYELRVESVRPASETEIEEAERRALSGGQAEGCGGPAIIPAVQLVRTAPAISTTPGPEPSPNKATTSDGGARGGKEARR